jgi:hypothetical protein
MTNNDIKELGLRTYWLAEKMDEAQAWMREAVAVLPHATESARGVDIDDLIARCPLRDKDDA